MIVLDAVDCSCTLAVTLVCFVDTCVAAQTALTGTSLIYFQGKEPVHMYAVARKESCEFLYSHTNKKLTRIRFFDPYLCCTTCGCMFVCLPS